MIAIYQHGRAPLIPQSETLCPAKKMTKIHIIDGNKKRNQKYSKVLYWIGMRRPRKTAMNCLYSLSVSSTLIVTTSL
jgi:hypothetical protein